MPRLQVYSRRGCHLCELLIEELTGMVQGRFDIDIRDIDSCDAWKARYDLRVPVVMHGEQLVCEAHLDRQAMRDLILKTGRTAE